MDGSQSPRAPGRKLWCPNGFGNLVDNIGAPGHEGAVLVLLGREPFWFCGVACAGSFLQEMSLMICEPSELPPGCGQDRGLWFMRYNTISEN